MSELRIYAPPSGDYSTQYGETAILPFPAKTRRPRLNTEQLLKRAQTIHRNRVCAHCGTAGVRVESDAEESGRVSQESLRFRCDRCHCEW